MRGTRLTIATLLVASAVAVAIAVSRLDYFSAPPPNVLLITFDTTRADRLGCYGHADGISPRIDALAAQGVVFDNAYTTASVTPVSHASILTGQNPYTHGLRVLHGLSDNVLPESATTLAEMLKAADYRTAAFISGFPAGRRFGLQQGFDTFDESFLDKPIDQIVEPSGAVNTGKSQRRADATTDGALKWLAETPERFFAWVHYFDPHDAKTVPPPEFLQQFEPESGTPEAEMWAQALTSTESRKWMLNRVYDIEIQYMDQQLGRVFDALEADGRWQDTIVIVVSDHGQGLGDHNWWTHGILYQEQIKAAFIVRVPGIAGGRRVKHVVRGIDIVPTVLDLVGLGKAITPIEGESLVPMLRAEAADPGYVAYADSVNILTYASEARMYDQKLDMLFAIVDDRWKYIHHALRQDESELYDLQQDPRELTNLYAKGGADLERLRQNLRARPYQPKRGAVRNQLSDEDRERLRALGYLE